MYNNNPMIRMEKRAVNKVGFVLIVLLAIAALVGGIYFVYKKYVIKTAPAPYIGQYGPIKKPLLINFLC